MQDKKLTKIYTTLFESFGPQGWWPAKTRFEVIVGAILTQNTNWKNVEKVIAGLKKQKLLSPKALDGLSAGELAALIRPAGYYNQKAKKLKAFLDYFEGYDFDPSKLAKEDKDKLRAELLGIWGIGPETADSILLYAFDKPVFVVDAYTQRVFSRMGFIDEKISYDDLRCLFENNMSAGLGIFKEYHALIDELAKRYCKAKPECADCPARGLCGFKSKT